MSVEDAFATYIGNSIPSRTQSSALRVVLAGRPGAGKGCQGGRLAQRLGVQYLSTGALLRDEIAAGSALGSAVERLVNAGRLVPSGLVIAIVESNLHGNGYVLDGFPRTVAQAEALCAHAGLAPTLAIELVVPAHVALERLTGRGRRDDDPAVARERLAIYEGETVPALAWLDRRGILLRVDGIGSLDGVEGNIWRALRSFRQAPAGRTLADASTVGSGRDAAPARSLAGPVDARPARQDQ